MLLFADKDRELGEAQAEIKALRLSERLREKAVEEVNFIFLVCFLENILRSLDFLKKHFINYEWVFLFFLMWLS